MQLRTFEPRRGKFFGGKLRDTEQPPHESATSSAFKEY
jgi:hypothetical protein